MSRSDQSRVTAHRRRALALIVTAALASAACGDDDSKVDGPTDGGDAATVVKPDANVPKNDAAVDAGLDAGRDAAGPVDAGPDTSVPDAAPPVATGTPSVAGEDNPVLAKVGFYIDELGPRILIGGSDKNGDIATFTITFFDKDGVAAVVNVDGMDETQDTSYTAPVAHDAAVQEFFAKFLPSTELLDVVKTIKVTVKDSGGRTSTEVTAKQMMESPVSGKCDPDGFNARCQANQLCAPSNASFSCQAVSSARMSACNSPSVLLLHPPTAGSVTGTLNSSSFWDMPVGCLGGGGKITGYDDRIVKLKLDATAAKLTLSTGSAPTFDSVIYKLGTCGENLPACVDSNCACGDNDLVLTNVAAGEYFIVVDSYDSAELKGNTFTLTATVE